MSNRRQNEIKVIEAEAGNDADEKAYNELVLQRELIKNERDKALKDTLQQIVDAERRIGELKAERDEIDKPFDQRIRALGISEASQKVNIKASRQRRMEYLKLLETIEEYQKKGYVVERLKHPVPRRGTDEFSLGQRRGFRSNYNEHSHVMLITLTSGTTFSILTDNAQKPWSLPTFELYPDNVQVVLSQGIGAKSAGEGKVLCPICDVSTNNPEKYYKLAVFEAVSKCIHAPYLDKTPGKRKKVRITWKQVWKDNMPGVEIEHSVEEFEE